MLAAQGIKLLIGVGLSSNLILSDGKVTSNGIYHARLKLHECVVVIGKRLQALEGIGNVLLVTLEHIERSRVSLGYHRLASKVGKGRDAGILLNNDYLLVEHVGLGEGVVIFAAFHGEAVPDAVDGTLIQQRVLSIPIDGRKLDVPTVTVGNFLSKIKVKTSRVVVLVHKTIRRIAVIEAHDELVVGRVTVVGAGLLLRATRKQGGRKAGNASHGQHRKELLLHYYLISAVRLYLTKADRSIAH